MAKLFTLKCILVKVFIIVVSLFPLFGCNKLPVENPFKLLEFLLAAITALTTWHVYQRSNLNRIKDHIYGHTRAIKQQIDKLQAYVQSNEFLPKEKVKTLFESIEQGLKALNNSSLRRKYFEKVRVNQNVIIELLYAKLLVISSDKFSNGAVTLEPFVMAEAREKLFYVKNEVERFEEKIESQ